MTNKPDISSAVVADQASGAGALAPAPRGRIACEACGRGVREVGELHRQNAKGEVGVWRCEGCNKKPVDAGVREILEAVRG